MSQTRREKQYVATVAEIKATARQLMAKSGAAGLSLREIAREMGMTAPALYHYFPNRDALVTALIVDAFNALADAIEQAATQGANQPARQHLLDVMLAYRTWALEHPVDFQLIYGSPIPGYEAPREITVPAAARGLNAFVALLADALARGRLVPAPEYRHIPADLAAHLASLPQLTEGPEALLALYLALVAWPRMHGCIMLELFGHLEPVVGDSTAFYRIQIEDLLRRFGVTD